MLLSHTSAHAGLRKFSFPLPPRAKWLPLNFLEFRLCLSVVSSRKLSLITLPLLPPLPGAVEYSFSALPLYPSQAIWLKLSSLINLKSHSNRDWFSLVSSGSALPTPSPTLHPKQCLALGKEFSESALGLEEEWCGLRITAGNQVGCAQGLISPRYKWWWKPECDHTQLLPKGLNWADLALVFCDKKQ